MQSDNRTNLVGAHNELKLCTKQLDQSKLHHVSNNQNIEWIFNPPASPRMEGVCESLIKSFKTALKAICTDENLQAFLCKVESILNGRLITSINDGTPDLEPLTSNHLLIGTASPNVSPGHFSEEETNLRRKWRSFEPAAKMFCKRWISQYLHILSVPRTRISQSCNFKLQTSL